MYALVDIEGLPDSVVLKIIEEVQWELDLDQTELYRPE
jgi:hypothetical protein